MASIQSVDGIDIQFFRAVLSYVQAFWQWGVVFFLVPATLYVLNIFLLGLRQKVQGDERISLLSPDRTLSAALKAIKTVIDVKGSQWAEMADDGKAFEAYMPPEEAGAEAAKTACRSLLRALPRPVTHIHAVVNAIHEAIWKAKDSSWAEPKTLLIELQEERTNGELTSIRVIRRYPEPRGEPQTSHRVLEHQDSFVTYVVRRRKFTLLPNIGRELWSHPLKAACCRACGKKPPRKKWHKGKSSTMNYGSVCAIPFPGGPGESSMRFVLLAHSGQAYFFSRADKEIWSKFFHAFYIRIYAEYQRFRFFQKLDPENNRDADLGYDYNRDAD